MNVQSRNHADPTQLTEVGMMTVGGKPLPRLDIMGVPVVSTDIATAVDALDQALSDGRRVKLAFLNAHTSNVAARDGAFQSCLHRFTIFNDGVGVNMAARLLGGARFAANLNGTDFVPSYLRKTRHRFRIFLLGGRPGIAEKATTAIERCNSDHVVVGAHHGYFTAAEEADVLRQVRASGADLLLVALGNPDQEKFVERYFGALNCEIAICVGALFDFLADAVPRAPVQMRQVGLEWLFRLMIEPRRLWRRYLIGNAVFLSRVVSRKFLSPRPRNGALSQPLPADTGNLAIGG